MTWSFAQARQAAADVRAAPLGSRAVATMRPGDEVNGVFACTRKDRLTARTGTTDTPPPPPPAGGMLPEAAVAQREM